MEKETVNESNVNINNYAIDENNDFIVSSKHITFTKKETKNEEAEDETRLEKLKLPKKKYAIIHGYLGHKYCGNQKILE